MLHSYSFEFLNEVDPITYLVFGNGGIDKAGEYALEIIDAIHRGTAKVDLGKVAEAVSNNDMEALKSAFNIEAYVNTIKKNQRLVNNAEAKKMRHICDVDDDGIVEPYGVTESVVSYYVEQKDEYEEFIDNEEVLYAVEQLYGMRSELRIEYRLDIIKCMKQALRGIPESLAHLKNLVVEAPQVGELIRIVLSSGKPLNELFSVE